MHAGRPDPTQQLGRQHRQVGVGATTLPTSPHLLHPNRNISQENYRLITVLNSYPRIVTPCAINLTRFNKIAIPNNKFQMASGQKIHWLIESPKFYHLCVARSYHIPVNSIFKHIHTTSINTIIWQFVPFIYHPQ